MPAASATLSVVLPAPGGLASIATTLEHLRAQTVRNRIEVVVVTDAPQLDYEDVDALASTFAAHRIVRLPKLNSRAVANAAGYRHAGCDVVAFAEDHCFPDPSWAEALLARHKESWAAVGPAIENANPASAVSWCDLLLNYAAWITPAAAQALQLPGHNTSYKRAALARYEDNLAEWLDVEAELHDDMRHAGERLFVEPAAKVAHVNISRWSAWLASLFYGGRIYAAARARTWPVAKRVLYAAAWPSIAIVRFARLLSAWPAVAPSATRLGPVLFAGLVADAAGQGLGYLAGAGRAGKRMARYELNRPRHVRRAERVLFAHRSAEAAARS
jgi:glycosyltransferase involved in cell wall biosynthesis